MINFSYDIVNGELLENEKTVKVNCDKAVIIGMHRRRVYDELLECYRDIEALFIRHAGSEYGKIGMTYNQYVLLCKSKGACADMVCPPDKIYVCVYNDMFI